jgi:hypothetical protein
LDTAVAKARKGSEGWAPASALISAAEASCSGQGRASKEVRDSTGADGFTKGAGEKAAGAGEKGEDVMYEDVWPHHAVSVKLKGPA